MTTSSVVSITEELKKWQPYIGKKAMIYSTSNYDKAMFELQTNPLKDVQLYRGEPRFIFQEGKDKKGYSYGSLGCISDRPRNGISFTPAEVRVYAESHIRSDERFNKLADNKDNLQIGQTFMFIKAFPHCTRISVDVLTLTNVTLAKGVQFNKLSSGSLDDVYSKDELEKVLDIVEKFASDMLGEKPAIKRPSLTFPRFVVNIVEEVPGGIPKDRSVSFRGYQYNKVEAVLTFLDRQYSSNKAIAVITDTQTNKVTTWKSK